MDLYLYVGLAFLTALAVSSQGFFRVVYFISTGYGFSVTAIAGLALVLTWNHLAWASALQIGLLIVYGLRLALYIVARQRSAQYAKEEAEVRQREGNPGFLVQMAIWVSVSLLYVLMTLPALLSVLGNAGKIPVLLSGAGAWGIPALGLAVMAGGLALETVADFQKNAYKKDHPGDFCAVGVYRVVRCPNYLGEVLVWVGNFIAGVPFYTHWTHWAGSGLGLVCIILIMMGSTKRLEVKQDERYGKREDYRSYIRRVPVLFPFVPVYSLKKIRVILE